MQARIVGTLILFVNIILYLISFFIGLRIILRFFSANSSAPIVAWIYDVSTALMYPFSGIFPDLGTQTGVLDTVAIISLLGYLVLGYLINWLLTAAFAATSEDLHSAAHYHDIDHDLEDEDRHSHHRSF